MKPIQNQRQNPNMARNPQDPAKNLGQPMEKKPMESKKTMDNRNCGKSSGNMGKPRDQSPMSLGRSQGQNSGKH